MLNNMHPFRAQAARNTSQSKTPIFSFVVVADTHVNERDDTSSSPFETNRTANERADHVFKDIAKMEPAPAFVLHLGDIVHPVPSVPTFQQAVARFKEISAQSPVPVYLTPGNHDVGDKCIDWMPADHVCEEYLDIYRQAFGADFHAFDHGPVRFISINSLLLNSGLPDEKKQRDWLEAQLDECAQGRVYLYMHYPPYIHDPKERSNYDNIDEPGRSWLIEQMSKPQVEAVFAGHVHNFWYDRVGSADFYMLPSTAFLRHDFTEFYKIGPSVEFGRGDLEKFGYFIVDVYEDGHVAYSVRTLDNASRQNVEANKDHRPNVAHPSTSQFDRVGAELRHPWTEKLQISATGGVQEFGRKWARNDYPLLALWEMGSRLSKLPDIDIADSETRARMQLMARLGHRYVVTSLGKPKFSAQTDEIRNLGIEAVEVNATLETFDKQKSALHAWKQSANTQLFLAKIHTFDDSHFDGKHFSHFVKSGFTLKELTASEPLITSAVNAGILDGITVRIEPDESIIGAAKQLMQFVKKTGAYVIASLKTGGINLATERADDTEMVLRVAQAMAMSLTSDKVRYVFDTFMDVDRGYFPRHGFIDRRCDLRPAAHAFTTINALISSSQAHIEIVENKITFSCDHATFELLHGVSTDIVNDFADSNCVWVHDLVQNTRYSKNTFDSLLASSKSRHVLLLQSNH